MGCGAIASVGWIILVIGLGTCCSDTPPWGLSIPLLLVGSTIIIVSYVLELYNSLVVVATSCKREWAHVEALLTRRHDIVLNLVTIASRYAKHERDTLQAVISARTRAVSAQDNSEKMLAEEGLGKVLGRLLVISEQYPQLLASQPYQIVMAKLSEIENDITGARMSYNTYVFGLQTAVREFPRCVVAWMFGIKDVPFFVAASSDRERVIIRDDQ